MKKVNKLVLSLVLGVGVVGAFSASYALYQNKTSAQDFSIGIGEVKSYTDSEDTITYSVGTVAFKKYSSDELVDWGDSDLLSPDLNKIVVQVPLSFKYSANLTAAAAQDYALGRLSVSASVNENIPEGTKVSAKLVGYSKAGDNKDQATYFTENKMSNFLGTKGSDEKYPSDVTFSSKGASAITGYIDTAIDTSNIYCQIEYDFSASITANNFFDLAELDKAFEVSVTWNGYKSEYDGTTYEAFDTNLKPDAFIRGDLSNWEDFDDYRMVPNINHAGTDVEWMYKLLKGFSQIKVYDGSSKTANKWIGCRGTNSKSVSFSSDFNAVLTKENSYNIYYVRNATSDKGFWVDATSEDDKITNTTTYPDGTNKSGYTGD